VAEDVEKVNPHLVVRDQEGKATPCAIDQVNAMLLMSFSRASGVCGRAAHSSATKPEIDALKWNLKNSDLSFKGE